MLADLHLQSPTVVRFSGQNRRRYQASDRLFLSSDHSLILLGFSTLSSDSFRDSTFVTANERNSSTETVLKVWGDGGGRRPPIYFSGGTPSYHLFVDERGTLGGRWGDGVSPLFVLCRGQRKKFRFPHLSPRLRAALPPSPTSFFTL